MSRWRMLLSTAGAGGAGLAKGSKGNEGGVEQAVMPPRITAAAHPCSQPEIEVNDMDLLLLEALGALALFVFIIWWTMFSGRKGGERQQDQDQ